MTDLSFFEKAFAQSEGVKRLYNDVCELRNNNNGTIKVCGLQGSSRAIAAHSLFCKLAKEDVCFVAVLDSYDDAAYFFQDFQKLSHNGILGNNIVFFPSETKRKGNNFVRDEDNIIMRTEVLGRLAHKDSPLAIITYPQAIAKKVPGAEEVSKRSFTVKENSCLDVAETENKLREWGFKPVDYVYAPGEYAVRGSIIDIFSYSCPDAFKCTCYSFKLFCAVGSDINFVTFRIEFLERALYQIEILVIKRLTTCMKRNGSCMFSRFCILRNATFYNHVFTRQSQKGFSHYVILWFVFGHRIFIFVNFCSVKSKITCKINCIVREKICNGNCFARR